MFACALLTILLIIFIYPKENGSMAGSHCCLFWVFFFFLVPGIIFNHDPSTALTLPVQARTNDLRKLNLGALLFPALVTFHNSVPYVFRDWAFVYL